MKPFNLVLTMAAALLALVAAPAAYAQDAPTCADLEFAPQIIDALPQANEACREVVMKNGEPFARFSAEIVRNRAGTVRAKFKRADGSWTETYAFNPDQSARVHVAGRSYLWRDIQRGQQLDLYLPSDRFEIATHSDEAVAFAETEVVIATIIVARAPREELPTTASFVPLVGALGGLFVALGAGIGFVRRRIRQA